MSVAPSTTTFPSTIAAAEAAAQLEHGAAVIDLRSTESRRTHGNLPNSIALAPQELSAAIERRCDSLPAQLRNGSPVWVICETGALSRHAVTQLHAAGYTQARAIEGGFAEWQRQTLPVVIESQAIVTSTSAEQNSDSPIRVSPMSGHTGAEIFGVDLTRPLQAEVVQAIRQALNRWKVVFFREQFISAAQLVQLGSYFGEVTKAKSPMQIYSVEGRPEILVVGKAEYPGRGVDAPWHSDLSFLQSPPMGSILQAINVPAYGGDTTFTNLASVYAGMSEPLQKMLDGLWAVHHDRFRADGLRTVHPVVRIHPETGEKLLWVNPNYTSHIVGFTARESRRLLDLLYEQLTLPAYTVRFRWHPGSLAFWDNRGSAHAAPTDLPDLKQPRILHRITIAGDVPFGPDGQPSFPATAEH